MDRKKTFLALILLIGIISCLLVGCTSGKITITFDTMGGNPVSPIRVNADAESLDLPIPERPGYIFNNWCYDEACTMIVNTYVIPTEDVTFYASWSPQSITITFDATFNGITRHAYAYVNYGGNLLTSDMPEVPQVDGYTGRWLTEDLRNVTAPITIYAEYTPSVYSVNYVIHGEVYFHAEGTAGTPIDAPDDPSIEDEEFLGWYLAPDYSEPTEPITAIGSSDITVYGWSENVASMNRYFTYVSSGGEITITGLTNLGKNQTLLVVPSEIGGLPVTSVGSVNSAIPSQPVISSDNLVTIALSDSVKTIGDMAFVNNSSLKQIFFSRSLTTVGRFAFAGNASLANITLPASVKTVGDFAFAGVMPASGNSSGSILPKEYDCEVNFQSAPSALKVLTFDLGSSLQSIGSYAFFNSALTSFVLPDSTDYVFDNATFRDSAVTGFGGYSSIYKTSNGAVYNADFSILLYHASASSHPFEIHPSTTEIAAYAFYDNVLLPSVIFPDSLGRVGDYAFYGCTALTTITASASSRLEEIGVSAFRNSGLQTIFLPSTLIKIEENAFRNSRIRSVNLGNARLTSIAPYAFSECNSLTTVVFGNINAINEYAFYSCENLVSLTFSATAALNLIGDYAFANCQKLGLVSLPATRVIGDYAFAGIGDKTMAINLNGVNFNTLTSLGEYAFRNNVNMNRFTGSSALMSIGEGAFYGCRSLSNVSLPNNTSFIDIPDYLFAYCTMLRTANIVQNIRSIGYMAYYGCTALSTVNYGGNAVTEIGAYAFSGTALTSNGLSSIDSSLEVLGEGAFYNCTALELAFLPGKLKEIPKYAFARCSKLNTISYGANCAIDTIGEEAFAYCTSLITANLPSRLALRSTDGDKSYGAVKNPFIGCTALTGFTIGESDILYIEKLDPSDAGGIVYARNGSLATLYLYPTGLRNVAEGFVIGNNVTKIDDYAFYGAMVSSVSFNFNLPKTDGVTDIALVKIGDYAFANSSLSSISLSDRVYSIGKYAFAHTALSGRNSLVFNDQFVSSLMNNYNILNRADAENNLLFIGDYAFVGINITDLTLPYRLVTLGNGAFSECFNLSSLTFNAYRASGDTTGELASLTLKIGEGAFRKDTSLVTIVLPAQLSDLGAYAFAECYNASTITFTNQANGVGLKIGDYAFKDNHYLYSVTLSSSITSLGEGLFYDCSRLAVVDFPLNGAFNVIPARAFYGCSSLLSIVIPGYIHTIGDEAFRATSITSLQLLPSDSDSLVIGRYAFAETDNLTSLSIPTDNLTTLTFALGAFYNSALTEIIFDGTRPKISYGSLSFAGTHLTELLINAADDFDDEDNLSGSSAFAHTSDLKDVVWSSSVIPSYAFNGSSLQTFRAVLTSADLTIGEFAFGNTQKLTSVIIDGNVNLFIEKGAFESSDISALELNGATDGKRIQLAENAFYAASLRELILPDNQFVFDVSVGAFALSKVTELNFNMYGNNSRFAEGFAYGAASLVSVNMTGGDGSYYSEDGVSYYSSASNQVLLQYPAGKTGSLLELSATVDSIGAYAFYGNPYLTTLTLRSESTVSFGDNAFTKTNGNLTLYVAEEKIGDYANLSIPAEALRTGLNDLILTLIGGDRYAISGYVGAESELTLNGTMSDGTRTYKIERIDSYAFANNIIIVSVNVGVGIKEIGEYAFSSCLNLSSVTLSDTVTNIKSHAFEGCVSLNSLGLNNGLLTIESYAFNNASSLDNVIIPNTLTTIGSFAFANTTSLNTLVIGSSVREISDNAFRNAINLVEVTLPAGVRYIRDFVFSGCVNLTFLRVEATVVPILRSANAFGETSPSLKIFVSETSVRAYRSDPLWRAYSSRILSYDEISGGEFSNYVLTRISGTDYRLLSYLGTEADVHIRTDLNGAGTITEIGSYSFSHFTKTVVIDDGVTAIGDYAFANATYLTSVTIPGTVKSIGARAFAEKRDLTTVTFLPTTVNGRSVVGLTSIGDYAFYNCTSLFASVGEGEGFVLPEKLVNIGNYAFAGDTMFIEKFTSRIAVENLLTIGDYAFANNVNLYTLTIASFVESIGVGAFSGCGNFHSLYLNSNCDYSDGRNTRTVVPVLKNGAMNIFENCDQLSIFVPLDKNNSTGLVTLYRQTWRETSNVYSNLIYCSSDIAGAYSDGFTDYHQDGFVISTLSGSSTFVSIVNYIGDKTEIVIPSVVHVGKIDYTVQRVGRDDNNLTSYVNGRVIGNAVTKVTIPTTVTTISGDAFRGAESLREIHFEEGSNLNSVGSYAFADCPNLTTVNLPRTLSALGNYAFANSVKLTDVIFGEYSSNEIRRNDLLIGSYAFSNTGLKTITLPSHVVRIGDYAFYNNIGLTNVNLPKNGFLETIQTYAFARTGITDISIPSSVASVGGYAFSYCSSLRYVHLNRYIGQVIDGVSVNSPTYTTSTVFGNIGNPFVKVYVPETSYDTYRFENWHNVGVSTVIPDLSVGEFNYRIVGTSSTQRTVAITSYLGSNTKIVIPRELNIDGMNYRVTTVASYFGNRTVEEITFEETLGNGSNVTLLEEYAFAGCSSLKKIHLPASVQTINAHAFEDCVVLTDVLLPGAGSGSGSNLSTLPEYAFNRCYALEEITIPASVTNISNSAFLQCSSLNRVIILNESDDNSCNVGLNVFTGTSSSLVIIVPTAREGAYKSQWSAYSSRIYAKSALFGNFILRSDDAGTGYVIVQYNGYADLDLSNLKINGRPVTGVASGAIIHSNVTVTKGE